MANLNRGIKSEPLFHVTMRTDIPLWKSLVIRIAAILLGLTTISLICMIMFGISPFAVFSTIIEGGVGTERRFWTLLQDS